MAAKMNFMLVDDDEDDRDFFYDAMQNTGVPVGFQWAKNGREALQLLKDSADLPDIVFLDLNMPYMNGKECLRQLKMDEELKNIPVVIYSTSTFEKDVNETLTNGATAYIAKPTEIGVLRQMIGDIILNYPNGLHDMIKKFGLKGFFE